MTVRLKNPENSQDIRIPKDFPDSVGFHVDDYPEAEIIGGNIILSGQLRHKTPEERIAAYNEKIRNSVAYDRSNPGEPVGGEEC